MLTRKRPTVSVRLAVAVVAAGTTMALAGCGGSDSDDATPEATTPGASAAESTPQDSASAADGSQIQECLEGENFEVNPGTTPDDLAQTFEISAEYQLYAPSGGYGSVTVYETADAAEHQHGVQQEVSGGNALVGMVGTSVYDWWGDEAEADIVKSCLS